MRRALLRGGMAGLSMRFLSKPHKAIEAEASAYTTLRENGTGCRAAALPKVRTWFEDAHRFRKVRILENPDDSFEDAHPFPRCALKTAHLREEDGADPSTGPRAKPSPVFPNIAEAWSDSYLERAGQSSPFHASDAQLVSE
jgi:hypothetical protein